MDLSWMNQIMTEDDTFNRLKRVPLDEVLKTWTTVYLPNPNKHLKDNGWTLEEFLAEKRKKHL